MPRRGFTVVGARADSPFRHLRGGVVESSPGMLPLVVCHRPRLRRMTRQATNAAISTVTAMIASDQRRRRQLTAVPLVMTEAYASGTPRQGLEQAPGLAEALVQAAASTISGSRPCLQVVDAARVAGTRSPGARPILRGERSARCGLGGWARTGAVEPALSSQGAPARRSARQRGRRALGLSEIDESHDPTGNRWTTIRRARTGRLLPGTTAESRPRRAAAREHNACREEP